MLDFSDRPYCFFPPRESVIWRPMLLGYNRWRYLPKVQRVVGVRVSWDCDLSERVRRGDRLLLMPNHPTHSDPYVYLEALSQMGVSTRVMAAYDVFLRRRMNQWVMQRLGAFSVDRDATDKAALRVASETLQDGREGLTIFPEGNVHLQNDRVTAFNDGAAMLGLRVAKGLASQRVDVLAVPVSIKLTYVEDAADVRRRVEEQLGEVEKLLGVDGRAHEAGEDGIVARLRAVAINALGRNLQQRGIAMPESGDDLLDVVTRAAGAVIEGLEHKIGLASREGDTWSDRLRKARRAIHEVRSDDERAVDHRAAAMWADEAMLAVKILSYTPNYVAARPTLDRVAETVEKLSEDLHGRAMTPMGDRLALVHFGEPISLGGRLDAFKASVRQTTRAVTDEVEQAVQAGVDRINEMLAQSGTDAGTPTRAHALTSTGSRAWSE